MSSKQFKFYSQSNLNFTVECKIFQVHWISSYEPSSYQHCYFLKIYC